MAMQEQKSKKALIKQYLTTLRDKKRTGKAGEHAYRAAMETLISGLDDSLETVNDPTRSEFGAPDFVFLRRQLIIGYAETKDLGVDLDKMEKSEQIERYFGYSNLLLTNYTEFRFFKNGERSREPIKIATLNADRLEAAKGGFDALADALAEFITDHTEPVTSGEKLARIMGGKARRIRDNVCKFLQSETESDRNAEISAVYKTIQKLLIADLTPETFADMYAQTLVYGLFVARFHDEKPDTFSRQEARDLVPASNPFLRHFFDHITGPNFDRRLDFIVQELCEVFRNSDVKALMEQYYGRKTGGSGEKGPDPVIHFYEDFLREYDPELRTKMGAYYTPLPVVRFIVGAIDEILRTRFGLPQGLADASRLDSGVHRVQVLDPAVGTGTFMSAAIGKIYEHILKQGQQGRWPKYVHNDLLPRIHGFEVMMAPYTIAHLKLSLAFRRTGFRYFNRRLGIYLTNSLEPSAAHLDLFEGFGLARSISEESKEAARIKNEQPIMVVTGNPPYSVSSQNKGKWIRHLIGDYKKDLNEKKLNLDDDYIKFIRLAEHFIEQTGYGIVAMITNNSFLDGITHRRMREHLLKTFDAVYVLDLHGNVKRKEKAPDGGKDENVFDIQQGVGISILVRENKEKSGLGTVYHADLYGGRQGKYEALEQTPFGEVDWRELEYAEPYYFFVPKDFRAQAEYEEGFKVSELFPVSNSGVQTDRDNLFIDFDKDTLARRMKILLSNDYDEEFKIKYRVQDSSSYKLTEKVKGKIFDEKHLEPIQYRPFEYEIIYYNTKITSRPAHVVFKHIMGKKNIALLVTSKNRQVSNGYFFVTSTISDRHFLDTAGDSMQVLPLYLYDEDGTRSPNLKPEIVDRIEGIVGETEPEDIFDYIYAVLHSPSYREKYSEFLKIDFPRVPYPEDRGSFEKLAGFGRELRGLHLLESPVVNEFITTYPVAGSDAVESGCPKYECDDSTDAGRGRVHINKEQYFGGVPETVWEFYVGGYRPAQKWLQSRRGRTLSYDDITHYQKIIVALTETNRLMEEIDEVL